MNQRLKIALVGNPNSGKSTIFNALTGLNQKVANFPGVTVDKRVGFASLPTPGGEVRELEIIDLPGMYSLYPKSPEEQLPFQILCDPDSAYHPDLTIVIADGTNLKRNLFLCSQIIDLHIPVVLVINMMDIVRFKKIEIDFQKLSASLGIPVVAMNGRKLEGLAELRKAITSGVKLPGHDLLDSKTMAPEVISAVKELLHVSSDYNAFLVANNLDLIKNSEIFAFQREKIKAIIASTHFDTSQMQARETLERYKKITTILYDCVVAPDVPLKKTYSYRIDNVLTHRVWGYVLFLTILFLVFQAIFAWATYPMELIDSGFAWLSGQVHMLLPKGVLNDLIVDGILAGLNGIVVFIPQIALLFFFIAILEDTGYMARVSFLMDRLMRQFGLNGKSVIPLMSGVACAVPAIMSTRTIQNWRERLITIMVTPLMSCSARLPVFTLLISLIIPAKYVYGINLQGLVLMSMYLIGFLSAIASAWVMKYLIKPGPRSFFVMEMPMYRVPRWSSIILHIVEKVKIFLFDAGKVIISISIILWVLSSFGPPGALQGIEDKYHNPAFAQEPASEIRRHVQSEKLEASYAGRLGHVIEPVIRPLGFDWKIGIALITSFAAREVFVGTMSTIYSVGDENSSKRTVKEKMQAEKDPVTGKPRYTFAVGFSLMLFYVFAMQCMSTVAVVYRETKHIKYPLIQIFYMSGLAYLSSLIAYQLLK